MSAGVQRRDYSDPIGMSEGHQFDDMDQAAEPGRESRQFGYNKQRWSLRSLSVQDMLKLAVSLVMVVMACTFMGLYFYQRRVNAELQAQAQQTEVTSTCPDTVGCIHTANRVLSYKDESLSPCANFYDYACNGFRRRHFAPDVLSGITGTTELLNEQRVNQLSRLMRGEQLAALNSGVLGTLPDLAAVYQRITDYYRACSTTVRPSVLPYISQSSTMTQLSQSVVAAVIAEIAVTVGVITSLDPAAADTMQRLHTELLAVSPNLLAQVRGLDTVGADIFPTALIDVVTYAKYTPALTPVLGLIPPILPSHTDFQDATATSMYRAAISKVLQRYLYDSVELADQAAATIADFEQQLAQIAAPRPVEFSGNWPQHSVASLQSNYPHIMGADNPSGWANFFTVLEVPQDVINSAATETNDQFAVHVSSPAYLQELDGLLSGTPAETVTVYCAYVQLLQLAALSQMHGTPIPLINYSALPTGFDPYAVDTNSLLSTGSAGLGRFDHVKLAKMTTAAVRPLHPDLGDDSDRGDSQANVLAPMDLPLSAAALLRNLHDSAMQAENHQEKLTDSPREFAVLESIANNMCVQDTMEKFSGAVAILYASLTLPDLSRGNVKKLVANVKSALRQRIADPTKETWLDDQSRSMALQKLDAMQVFVGFPESFLQPGFLNKFYGGAQSSLSRSNFFRNAQQTVRNLNFVQFRVWTVDFAESSLELFQDWTQVNAFNALAFNRVVLPMGFLQPLVYRETDPLVLNYGSVGYIVGHEMAHAFSPSGLQYDQYGAGSQLLSDAAMASYNAQKQCFASFYSQNIYLSSLTNGTRTFPDSFADHVGLKASWDAFVAASTADDYTAVRLPGLVNFTDSQLFYLGFGQLYCTVADCKLLQTQHSTAVHPIPLFRVTSALSLLPGFSKAWSCDKASTMGKSAGSCSLFKRELRVIPHNET